MKPTNQCYLVERLWRSVKYEAVYLMAYDSVAEAGYSLAQHHELYNTERRHQSLVAV